jgi:hypothetical protein
MLANEQNCIRTPIGSAQGKQQGGPQQLLCCYGAWAKTSRVVVMALTGIPKPRSATSGRVRASVNNNNMDHVLKPPTVRRHTSLQLFLTPPAPGHADADGISANSSRPTTHLPCAALPTSLFSSQVGISSFPSCNQHLRVAPSSSKWLHHASE